jgi:hypothetical protein
MQRRKRYFSCVFFVVSFFCSSFRQAGQKHTPCPEIGVTLGNEKHQHDSSPAVIPQINSLPHFGQIDIFFELRV